VIFNCFKLFIKAFKYNKQRKGEINMKYEAPTATLVSFMDSVSAIKLYSDPNDLSKYKDENNAEEIDHLRKIGYFTYAEWWANKFINP
jgi:hypothetical protein